MCQYCDNRLIYWSVYWLFTQQWHIIVLLQQPILTVCSGSLKCVHSLTYTPNHKLYTSWCTGDLQEGISQSSYYRYTHPGEHTNKTHFVKQRASTESSASLITLCHIVQWGLTSWSHIVRRRLGNGVWSTNFRTCRKCTTHLILSKDYSTAVFIDLAMTKQKALESNLICDTQKLCLQSVLWLCT